MDIKRALPAVAAGLLALGPSELGAEPSVLTDQVKSGTHELYQRCVDYHDAKKAGEDPDFDLQCESAHEQDEIVPFDMADIADQNHKNFLKQSLAEAEGAEPRVVVNFLARGVDVDGTMGMQPDQVYNSGNTIDLQPRQSEKIDMFGVFSVTEVAAEQRHEVVGLCSDGYELDFKPCSEKQAANPNAVSGWGDSYRWWPVPFTVSREDGVCQKIVFALGEKKSDGSYEVLRDVDGREVMRAFFVVDYKNAECFSAF